MWYGDMVDHRIHILTIYFISFFSSKNEWAGDVVEFHDCRFASYDLALYYSPANDSFF